MRGEKPKASSAVSFLPVNVTVDKPSRLAVLIDDHLRIEIPAGFDPVTLKQVVQALQSA
jgi:adenylate kinase